MKTYGILFLLLISCSQPMNEESGTIRLIDITGKDVLSMSSNPGSEKIELSVNNVPPGAYTLLIKAGMNNFQQKIIVVDH